MKSHTSQLTQFFNPHPEHPLLEMKGKIYTDLISWMIASTDTWKDRSSQERFQKQPEWCRLCLNENTIESRQHLLTVCPATAQLINSFSENLGRISIEKEKEYSEFSHDKKWKWILGGGLVKQVQKVNQYRLTIPKSVFSRGENVTNRIDKKT